MCQDLGRREASEGSAIFSWNSIEHTLGVQMLVWMSWMILGYEIQLYGSSRLRGQPAHRVPVDDKLASRYSVYSILQ